MSTETIIDPKPSDKAIAHLTKKGDAKSPAIELPKPDYGKTIAIRCLTFHQAHPNLDARHSISAESASGKGLVTIEFVPALRHHRVEIQKPGVPTSRVMFIYEGHVASFEPL